MVNQQFAYVAGSRPRFDLQFYTDNRGALAEALSDNTPSRRPSTPQHTPKTPRRRCPPCGEGDSSMEYSFDDLLPHIRPLAPLLADPAITEIMVNAGGRAIFTERGGRLYQEAMALKAEGRTRRAIEVIARMVDQEPSEAHPLLNARLSDGSRVAAALSPQSPDGDVMTIRKFGRRYTLDQLVEVGSLTPSLAALLRQACSTSGTSSFAGGTGTGKTTMVNALADTIPAEERVLLIESTSEIYLDKPETWCGSKRVSRRTGQTWRGLRSRLASCCVTPSGSARTASSWERCAAWRRGICSRHSTRGTRVVCRLFMATRPKKR